MKRKTRRRLFAVSGGRGSANIGPMGAIRIQTGKKAGGRSNNPIPTFTDWGDLVNKYKDDPQKGAEDLAGKVINHLKEKLESNIKTKGNFTITLGPSDHTNGEDPVVPAFVENSKSKHVLANADDDRFIHKTVYHTGKKPSSAILAAKKQNGSGYRVLADSMIEVTSAVDRNVLTQRTGFNQKLYHVPPIKAQVPVYLVKDLCAWDQSVTDERYATKSMISNVVNIKQQFMIKNTAAHFPMKFTIHLVKIKNNDYGPVGMASLMFRSFYTAGDDLDDLATLKTGPIPKWLQHSLLSIEGEGKMQSARVTTSNKLRSLNASSTFRSGAQIVESFSKVIPPGDFWNFSHVHHCGSGIDLVSLYRSTNENSGEEEDTAFGLDADQFAFPFHYGIIFEVQGKTAEAYSIPAENIVNSYIGSSPCSYSYEFKTSAYFAAESLDNNNISTPSIRTYEQDNSLAPFGDPTETREKFFDATDLVAAALTPSLANVGKAYVPMMTTSLSSSSLFEATQDPG